MQRKCGIHQKSEGGQSFTELAISLVFLLILVTGVIQLGWAFYTMTALRDTAQEAASYGTICPIITDDAGNKSDNVQGIRDRLRQSATSPLKGEDIHDADIEVTFMGPTGDDLGGNLPTNGDIVRVSVVYRLDIKVLPFAGSFLGDNWSYPLNATVSDIIMVKDCKTTAP